MADEQLPDLHWQPIRILRPAGTRAGAPDDADLAIVNERFAAEPLTADDIFAYSAIASSDALDSYSTHMDPETTLRNYEADLAAGQALLDSHNSYQLPFGSSFRAQLQPVEGGMLEGVPATVQVFAGYFFLRNHVVNGRNTEEYRKGILGGTLRKKSIGFGGSEIRYICDLDGKDLWDSNYYPGERLKDGTVVTYKIVNARAMETSIVFKNGSPGALIQRVQALVDQRHIPASEITRLEGAWGVRFAGKPVQHFLARGVRTVEEKDIRELMDRILTRAGKKLSASTREKLSSAMKTMEDAAAVIAGLLEETGDDEDRAALVTELGELANPNGVRTLKAQAKAGAAYVAGLIAETVKARVAVAGDSFDAKRYEARLATMDIDDLVDERDAWAGRRSAAYTPGRQVPVGTGADKPHSEFLEYDDA